MSKLNLYCFTLATLLLHVSCRNNEPEETQFQPSAAETDKIIKEQFIKANQLLMQKENDEMDYYAKSHNMPFYRTDSGIRYFVYKASAKGDSIREDMEVNVDFEISLLNGTLCYSSKEGGRKTIMIGHDDVESGIHKGLQYLKRGDKAILLIPSPLAHGLLGDFKKIPPQMPIMVDVTTY